ncbi:MAG: hypothetical protein LAP13_14175 [Acidobacteriia bacterium]|nr:hypothetical protein [Terriglobia bacterium]
MKTNRTFKMVRNLVLALACGALLTGTTNAQGAEYGGKFTLPFEAQWGRLVLPAGNYSFTLNYTKIGMDMIMVQQGTRTLGMVLSRSHSQAPFSDRNELIVTRSGGRARIVALHAAELGTDFYYRPPKPEGRLIAGRPELIQRIPVSRNGK